MADKISMGDVKADKAGKADNAEINSTRLRPDIEAVCRAEEKQGYLDSAILGGFGAWAADMADGFTDCVSESIDGKNGKNLLKALGEAYTDAALIERPELLRQIRILLGRCGLSAESADVNGLDCLQRSHGLHGSDCLQRSENPASGAVSASVSGSEDAFARLQVGIEYLKGVGPKRATLLRKIGVYHVRDLLLLAPRDYDRRPAPSRIADVRLSEPVVICGRIQGCTVQRFRKLAVLKVLVGDESGSITVLWYNQQHMEQYMTPGRSIVVFGKAEQRFGTVQLVAQDHEFAERPSVTGPLPVYPLTTGLSQKNLRRLVATAWEKYSSYIGESLPEELLRANGLISLKQAIYYTHFPHDDGEIERGRQRMAFEELLVIQLTVLKNRLPDTAQSLSRCVINDVREKFVAALSFSLTGAQTRVIDEIYADMDKHQPMRRLVQGDVGSGKTVVAAAALYKNFLAGWQGALMAPTEILAEQHYRGLASLLGRLGIRVELLTGDTTAAVRRDVLARLRAGEIDVLIGTHALFSEDVEFAGLGLAVTDEQHRFGVGQRNALRQKGELADVLVLTATPIPRTLALTFCGDLNVSVIDELPPGRQPIQTVAAGYDIEGRVWNFVRGEIAKGRQAYVVCPLVEESEALELESAIQVAERLSREQFVDCRVGLLYGKMKPQEKADVMQRFAAGDIQLLVSTTVIEVGVDVPNATVMVIRDAERFGLSQLHQLRGRVGRGSERSYCVLLNNARSREQRERIKTMTDTNDGFVIAEADLRLRGAGELLGTRQSGISTLKYANLATDLRLAEAARQCALKLLQSGEYLSWPIAEEVRRRGELLES